MFNRIKKLPFEKILAVTSILILVFVSILAFFEKIGQQDVSVQIRLQEDQDPFVILPQIVPENSSIRLVREIDKSKNKYIMTIRTKKKNKDVLDWILKFGSVEDAQIHD